MQQNAILARVGQNTFYFREMGVLNQEDSHSPDVGKKDWGLLSKF